LAISEAVQAEVSVIQKPETGAEGASASAGKLEDLITGKRSVGGTGEVAVGALAAPADAGRSVALQPASAAAGAKKDSAVPASIAQAPKATQGRFAYEAKRRALVLIASMFGITASLPPVGPRLEQAVLSQAAGKRVVFSDFDDTLGPYNSVLTPEMSAAISAVRKAGKQFAVITDRTDVSGGRQLSAFESLATIPAEDRAGMYVAAVSGGKVYRYNEQGEPVKVWEYPAFDESRRQPVLDAIAATKAQLSSLGTTQHPGDDKNPAESWQPYSYAMMLAVGTPEAAVKKAARLFESELRQRGMDVSVNARIPKDPANTPYIQFSIVDKSASVKYIAGALGVKPWEALAMGDNMYVPQTPEQPGGLARLAQGWAEKLSGRPVPFTGNETDRNMEKALPGMMALSVGGSVDPRMAHAYALSGKGAAESLAILRSVASRPADKADPARYWKIAAAAAAIAVVAALALWGWWTLGSTSIQVISSTSGA
jgi:hydroxymethylpyrimidine pyrophosphatase-like HAD family hydrolase